MRRSSLVEEHAPLLALALVRGRGGGGGGRRRSSRQQQLVGGPGATTTAAAAAAAAAIARRRRWAAAAVADAPQHAHHVVVVQPQLAVEEARRLPQLVHRRQHLACRERRRVGWGRPQLRAIEEDERYLRAIEERGSCRHFRRSRRAIAAAAAAAYCRL